MEPVYPWSKDKHCEKQYYSIDKREQNRQGDVWIGNESLAMVGNFKYPDSTRWTPEGRIHDREINLKIK